MGASDEFKVQREPIPTYGSTHVTLSSLDRVRIDLPSHASSGPPEQLVVRRLRDNAIVWHEVLPMSAIEAAHRETEIEQDLELLSVEDFLAKHHISIKRR